MTELTQHSWSFLTDPTRPLLQPFLYLSTHMPELLSPTACKVTSTLSYSSQEHKTRSNHSPAGNNKNITECSPRDIPAAQLLIFNSFVFQMLKLFRELTYSAVYS